MSGWVILAHVYLDKVTAVSGVDKIFAGGSCYLLILNRDGNITRERDRKRWDGALVLLIVKNCRVPGEGMVNLQWERKRDDDGVAQNMRVGNLPLRRDSEYHQEQLPF